ncbi:SagB/ThcOx family dehydrogenase [Streptomyces sp. NPDC020719]|uniref:SagB/ThcOx family dehydrogenase n=1 Tax=Streptomyces sp. NPDC020719 TaxID=3154896 RepID=UPI0033E49F78
MQLRRAATLVCYWHHDDFVIHDYLRRTTTVFDPVAAEILSLFDDWTDSEQAVKNLDGCDPESVGQAIAVLRERGLLLTPKEFGADGGMLERAWGTWAPEADMFHFATRDASFEEPTPESRQERVREGRPAIFKNYPGADRILLPRRPARLTDEFGRVLYTRRTHRAFTGEPVPLDVFAALLSTVFGPAGFIDADAFGTLMLRTSASGGARHELEAYVAVFDVTGIESGVYHYNVLEHSLELLRQDCSREHAARLCADQSAIRDAAFVVFVTAVVERMAVKYRHPRAYRVMLMNAGHFGQTFALTATALGLGPFQTAAFNDSGVEQMLGVDGMAEVALYALAAGWPTGPGPARSPAGLESFGRTVLCTESTVPRD